ncbi:MAG TPA: hypothetical protein VFA46_05835 [Actinomycetes bacterium]|jgi:hypothetical protein|nr:hypothetical protein [Actinomycetes bacterium]
MPEQRLPLDDRRYHAYLIALRELVERDPDLTDGPALREFLHAYRGCFGPRTADLVQSAGDDLTRVMTHVMVLAASELSDLHEASRRWLGEHGHSLPPWDVAVPRTAQRLIAFAGKVYGVVEWEPRPGVELESTLDPQERRWATALAVGIGERPQWTNAEVWRYAAYLVMGTEEFATERVRSDAELAERYGIPVEAVQYRRGLPDEV